MSARCVTCRATRLAALPLSIWPAAAWPHAFDERYDLPAPLAYFVAGATAAVALSFVVGALFMHRPPASEPAQGRMVRLGPVLPALRTICGVLSVILLAVTITAGWFGTRDPMMNLAPTLVWVIFSVGLALVAACVGNVWPVLDPWSTLFGWLNALARHLGRPNGIVLGLRYPRSIGAWPAVAFLLAIGWLEVVYPEGAEPHRMAQIILAWSAVTVIGAACFGREQWQRNADVFSVYFGMLGRFAPLAPGRDPRSLVLRPPGRGLLAADVGSAALVGFIIAMLATVLFDGLLSGQAWWAAQAGITRAIPWLADNRGYLINTLGLVTVWMMLLAGFVLSCRIAAALVPERSTGVLVRALACTLVPIAIGYNIAHNSSNLLVQGQQVIPLLSDPLGRHWDLFGTAAYRANIGIVDARTTWYVAIAAIVTGHVISIWLAHRVALREFGARRKAVIACVPLTVLMLLYTAISLSVIAEPMVKFDEPTGSAMQNRGQTPILRLGFIRESRPI